MSARTSRFGFLASTPVIVALLAAGLLAGPGQARAETETGIAAVYSTKLNGRKTASGQRYDMNQMTAAHKTLPFGTHARITNLKNHKSVTVRINDRGPYHAGRIVDLSSKAARGLGLGPLGTAEVKLDVVEAPVRKASKPVRH